jgi:hypothetical protein
MEPISATVGLSHVNGVSDSARERELYKYVVFQQEGDAITNSWGA